MAIKGKDKREKYFTCRGKNYEDNCQKSQADMDDVLPGVIIDAVLGIDMNETTIFKGQLDDVMYYRGNDPGEQRRMRKEVHSLLP